MSRVALMREVGTSSSRSSSFPLPRNSSFILEVGSELRLVTEYCTCHKKKMVTCQDNLEQEERERSEYIYK